MATAAKFRIDVAIHDLLMNSNQRPPAPAESMGLTLRSLSSLGFLID